MSPKFSIIMANHNRGKYISEAIQSILNQSVTDWELIITDDGSTDNSLEVINSYDDSRIILNEHSENKGVGKTHQTSMAVAQGEIIVVVDSDDALVPVALETLLNTFNQHPEINIAYSKLSFCDANLKPIKKMTGGPIFTTYYQWAKEHPHGSTVAAVRAFKKELYDKSQGYGDYINAIEKDLLIKLEEVGGKLYFIDEVLYLYRRHPSSLGKTKTHDCMPEILASAKKRRKETKSNFIVTAFYTLGTPYEQEIKNLIKSIDKFNLDSVIHGVPSRGSWVQNAAIKSEIILKTLQDNPRINVLYLDADAIIQQYPKLFDNFSGDIGVHYRTDRGHHELLSGTLFFKNTSKVLTLISKWIYEQSRHPDMFDQKVLDRVIKEDHKQLTVVDLPPSYTQIFDSMKHYGDPVIEHFQASRRFKKHITKNIDSKLPKQINGMRVRPVGDGSFFLPRATNQLLKRMELDFVKMSGELRFYPKHTDDSKYFENLRPVFEGQYCYLVGKGPSLDHITKDLFSNSDRPILCINEAIHKVEELGLRNPIFAVQQDHSLGDTCKPKYGEIFVSYRAREAYKDYKNKYIYYPESYKGTRTTLTVLVAINIAKSLGAVGFELIAFDACTNEETDYAEVIGYKPSANGKGNPKRFLAHKKRIVSGAKETNLVWIKRDPNSTSFYKLPQ